MSRRRFGVGTTIGHSSEESIHERDRLVERLMQATSGVFDIFTVQIGNHFNYYGVLAHDGPLTSTELATHTGTHERYVREWLEQQTVAGILAVENPEAAAIERRFRIPSGHVEVLVERDSLNYLAPLAQITVGAVYPFAGLLAAFRTGGGVHYRDYGVDMREGQAGMNRAAFLSQFGSEWLPAIPDMHARLQAVPPARVADIGCGAGWSSIGIARAYPNARVDGFDLDAPSIDLARANAHDMGVTDTVTFQVRDAGDPALAGHYDLVTACECIHDMSQPVAVLRSMRKLAGEHGTVLVVDERVGERFTPTGTDVERMMYGWSVLHCLPVGMADTPSAETGTVMRPDTLRRYAREAGFRAVEILPIEHYFFTFYRLVA
jgi:2-polyprenyl-3-methyl-5-hydroxy-6-metoxy-1,4-benzoquinol methylase